MKARRLLTAAAVLLALSPQAGARMYQWLSPTTGSVQLSGEPPAWYRAAESGPRVRVFENGNLVDDTAIRLPESRREELRQAAFRESEQRERSEALKRLERAAMRQKRRREAEERIAEAEREEQRKKDERLAQESQQEAVAEVGRAGGRSVRSLADGPLDQRTVDRLKAIISDFDRRGAR